MSGEAQGIHLVDATAAAKRLVTAMSPFCERIEIAGSIRRRKLEVKDIEIVCVPKWAEKVGRVDLFANLFSVNLFSVNLLHSDWATTQSIMRWIKPGVLGVEPWRVAPEGEYWRGHIESLRAAFGDPFPDQGCKVDIFLVTPSTFGLQYLIRTGSADFSKEVVTHALRVGHKVEGGKLWDCRRMQGFVGKITALTEIKTTEEAHVFAALNLAWVEPCDRTGASAVRADWNGGTVCPP